MAYPTDNNQYPNQGGAFADFQDFSLPEMDFGSPAPLVNPNPNAIMDIQGLQNYGQNTGVGFTSPVNGQMAQGAGFNGLPSYLQGTNVNTPGVGGATFGMDPPLNESFINNGVLDTSTGNGGFQLPQGLGSLKGWGAVLGGAAQIGNYFTSKKQLKEGKRQFGIQQEFAERQYANNSRRIDGEIARKNRARARFA